MIGANVCLGDAAIAKRAAAIRNQIQVLSATNRVITDRDATSVQRAEAFYALGRQWERTDGFDPTFATFELQIVRPVYASEAYHSAIEAAPGSRPAGSAAWRLIEFAEPADGHEGDWQAAADARLGPYAIFLKKYPRHPLAGEAMFMVASAHWTKAGYPEVLGYFQEGEDSDKRALPIDTWFDTSGFGGPVPRTERHPEASRKALKMFRTVALNYPNTKSAANARYYAAVILDWCLRDTRAAAMEYARFIARYPKAGPMVAKARARLAALQSAR